MTTQAPSITVHDWHRGHWYEVPGHPNPNHPKGWWRSVTTTLGAAVAKPGLVGWARKQAYDSVRQVLYKSTDYPLGALGDAAWIEDVIELARAVPTTEAADYGTEAHAQIAAALAGVTPLNPSAQEFVQWRGLRRERVAYSEIPVFCPCHEIAGTVDFIAERDGLYTLGDLKTGGILGRPPYSEWAFQVGAYAHAAQVWLGIPISRAIVVQVPKTRPEARPYLAVHTVRDLDAALAGYLSAAALAEAMAMKLFEEAAR